MSFLLDTNVVSETRRRAPNGNVLAWLQSLEPDSLYLSVLTIGELAKGISRLRSTDANAAATLDGWFHGLCETYSDRLLPIDAAVATRWGSLDTGRTLPVAGSLLAATAAVHGLVLATRNAADFLDTGVTVFDPWTGSRSG